MAILTKLIRTIFLDLLSLTGGVGAIAIVNCVLQSFVDAAESRRKITRILGNVAFAMCSAMLIVVIIQILKPIVNPKKFIDKLTDPGLLR